VTPGVPEYQIGSPVFSKITINLPDGKTFTIIAEDNSQTNKYIQSASLNGNDLTTTVLSHRDLVSGGKLVLKMGARPNRAWGIQ